MPPPRKDDMARSNLTIAAVLHALIIGAVVIWAAQTGRLEKVLRTIGVVPQKREEKKEPPKPPEPRNRPAPKLPPINQGAPQSQSKGTRRAVASDAPASSGGGSFFQDTRQQVQGAGTPGGSGGQSQAAPVQRQAPTVPQAPVSLLKSAVPSSIRGLLQERQKAAAVTEAFGSEQISRTGVSDAGDIVNKVAGASVVDGKFAVIRGLSERYVTTTLNGAEVPSADPYRKSASLDLFPSQIIDKVVIAKTFTPDQPGTYTGGGINIVTKSFPSKPFLSLSVGGAYNTQSTLNDDFLSYEGGAFDWAATDDGSRSIAPALAGEGLVVPSPPFTSGPRTSPTYQQRIQEAERLRGLTEAMGVTEFAGSRKGSGLNNNFSISGGETTHFLGRPLGLFAGLSYSRGYSFYEDGITRRYGPGGAPGVFQLRKENTDTKAVEEANWAGVMNLAYQLGENHELGFNFLYNQNSEDVTRKQTGTSTDDVGVLFHLNRLHFTERNLRVYQLKGAHTLPDVAGLKVDWLAALSGTSQAEPDTRFFNYAEEGGVFVVGKASAPDPKNPTRYFRDLEEDNRNLKLDFTLPFRPWGWREGELKAGLFDSSSERRFVDREVYYQGDAVFNGDPNGYLTPGNLGYTTTTNASNGRINYTWDRYLQTRDSSYRGEQGIQAGYSMLDVPLVESLRLIGGVRWETTDLSVASRSYLANSVTGSSANSSQLDEVSLLPAAGLVYALRTNMNLRFSYSQTIARPSFRELAGYRSYDPTLDELLDGNPSLRMSRIENWDARWEWFPRPGEVVGASIFMKDLKDAIERRYVTLDGEIITFDNRETAQVYGVELEARKSLDLLGPGFKEFSIGGNISLIQSEVRLTPEELNARSSVLADPKGTRPLYDQSPYIVNVDFSYDNPYTGTSATVIFNVSGPRITIASLNSEDIYEQPAPGLDLVFSQRITRKMKARFTVRNILDPVIERTYGEEGADRIYSSYRRGRTFGLSMSYEF